MNDAMSLFSPGLCVWVPVMVMMRTRMRISVLIVAVDVVSLLGRAIRNRNSSIMDPAVFYVDDPV